MKRQSEERKTRKVTTRFTPAEYQLLGCKVEKSTSKALSDYIRRVALGKPIVIKYRNESLENLMEEVISLREELNAIGKNVNQAIKKLHLLRQIPEFRNWISQQDQLFNKVAEATVGAQRRIDEITDKWLRE